MFSFHSSQDTEPCARVFSCYILNLNFLSARLAHTSVPCSVHQNNYANLLLMACFNLMNATCSRNLLIANCNLRFCLRVSFSHNTIATTLWMKSRGSCLTWSYMLKNSWLKQSDPWRSWKAERWQQRRWMRKYIPLQRRWCYIDSRGRSPGQQPK